MPAIAILTNAEDVGHLFRVIGVLLDVADTQNAVQDQAIVSNVSIQCNKLDQLRTNLGIRCNTFQNSGEY